jgi:outer membrane protein assembly factor BamB
MRLKVLAGSAALVCIATAATIELNSDTAPCPGVDWPQFRGIRASGVAEGFSLATSWSVTDGQGIAWKAPIPGLGLSSPVVWGDAIFVTTSISGDKNANLRVGYYGDIESVNDTTSHEWRVYCLDKKTGAVRWQQTAYVGVPKIKRHMKNSHANSTVATDGQRVIAFFGSEGLYAYDMKGTLLWKKDLGVLDAGFYMVPDAQWETGSSPVIHENAVVVQADVQKGSFIGAFDARDGRELWRTTRDDVPTWSTPTIHEVGGRTQLAVNGLRHIGGYDFKTGKEIWKMKGLGDIPVPTPVVQDGLIYVTNAHGKGAPVFAIRETASGDISLSEGATSNDAVVWSYPRGGGYMATPVVYRGLLYVVNYNGVLMVYDSKTGERKYQERLGRGTSAFTSSPVAADGKVFIASEDGHVIVLEAGPTFKVLADNDMTESTLATPALSEGLLLVRTQRNVVAIKGATAKPSGE